MVDNPNPIPPGPAGPSAAQTPTPPITSAKFPAPSNTDATEKKSQQVPKWVDQMCPGATQEEKVKFYNQALKTMAQNFNTIQQHHKEHVQEAKEDGDSIIG